MHRFLLWIGAVLSLLLPLSTEAVTAVGYDLRPGLVNAQWEGKGAITLRQTENGMLLHSGAETGMFLTSNVPAFSAEGISVVVTAKTRTSLQFVWLRDAGTVSSIPLNVPAGNNQPMSFSIRQNPAWIMPIQSFGVRLPPNTDILLHRIDVVRWSLGEKIENALASLLTFDDYRPYSINFVWGPLLALNPIELHAIYRNLPPQEIYATYVLYWGLMITLAGLMVFARFVIEAPKRRSFIIRTFIITALGCWILLDLRMGSEFLSWVHADRATYIAAPESMREFRDRGRFYDFAAFAEPYVHDRNSYVFFSRQQWPYLGNMRYLTYPAIPGIGIDTDDTWVIYDRPDMNVNEQGQITIGGKPVSGPGEILGRFDNESFVFRTFNPPSAR